MIACLYKNYVLSVISLIPLAVGEQCFSINKNGNTSSLQHNTHMTAQFSQPFIGPNEILDYGNNEVVLFTAFIIEDIDKKEFNSNLTRMERYLHRWVYSLFSESTGTPLHLIFLTDINSKGVIQDVMKKEVGRILTRKYLTGKNDESKAKLNWNFPRFHIDFLDIEYFNKYYQQELDSYIEYFCPETVELDVFIPASQMVEHQIWKVPDKCRKSFKYVQFLLHKSLPNHIKNIILLDVDLRFRMDLGDLQKYFQQMNKNEFVALAKDWNDFTRETEWYNQNNPDSIYIGAPGPFQHLNSGVVLMDLEKIRGYPELGEIMKPKSVKETIKEFNIPTWGDQIFYTMMRWKYPNKVYFLSCVFNFQPLLKVSRILETKFSNGHSEWNQNHISNFHYKQFLVCKGEAKIDHLLNDMFARRVFLTHLFKYNDLFKLSPFCWNNSFTHCY